MNVVQADPVELGPQSRTFWERFDRTVDYALSGLAIVFALYMMYATVFGPYKTTIVHYVIFIGVNLFIYFINDRPEDRSFTPIRRLLNWTFGSLAAAGAIYIFVNYTRVESLFGALSLKPLDVVMGSVLVLVVLEAARRSSLGFFILSIISFAYIIYGNLLSGVFAHPGMDYTRFVYLTAFTQEGIFGVGVEVAALYLFMFLVLSAAMTRTGTGQFIINLCNAAVGHKTGGQAKVAVLASAGLGTMTGSAIANVVTTGTFTIPLMKKSGFKPEVAAAVETVASEGSQIMPPVLGATAFIMAEMTDIPYATIALAATLPAFLYYLSTFAVVHIEALRMNILGIPKDQCPKLRQVMTDGWHLLLPPIVLFYLLIVEGYTPNFAGLVCVALSIAVAMLRPISRMTLREIFGILDDGVRMSAQITALVAAIGLIIQGMTTTGLGARLTEVILTFGGNSVLGTSIVGMLIATVLGMGMPGPIAYVLMALFVAPAMEVAGVPTLAAHLFLFYFAIKSGSTPPVAVVATVAAGLAQANWWKTGVLAFQYSLPGFIVAFMFIYSPPLLMVGTPLEVLYASVTASIGVVAAACAVQGWLYGWLTSFGRAILLVGAILLVKSGIYTDLAGVLIIGGVYLARPFLTKEATGPGALNRSPAG